MKLISILLIPFFVVLSLYDTRAQDVMVSNTGMKTNAPRIPSLAIFQQDLPANTNNRTRFKTLPVAKVYRRSATIFDATVITLLKDSTYIAYYAGCLASGMTAGSYTCKGDTLVLTGSEKIYRSLSSNEEVKKLNYGTMLWGTLHYLRSENGLISLK